jgi:hypothetical protein
MPNKRSAGSFCSLVVSDTTGPSDSVESLPVAALGSGAECYSVANRGVYRYDAASTQANLAGTDAFVKPLVGPGCWFKREANGAYTTLVQLTTGGVGGQFMANGTWQALPSTGAGAFSSNNNPFFTVDTTTGIMTYNGPTGVRFLVMATLSLASLSASGVQIDMDLTVNGALLGTTTLQPSLVSYTQNVSGHITQCVQNFQRGFAPGQTLQHVLLVQDTTLQVINRYQVTILKVD